MKLRKNMLSIAICFTLVMGLMAGVTMPVLAHEEYDGGNVNLEVNPEFDLSDFEYEIIGSIIYLNKYNGTAEDIFIPEEVKYEGEKCTIRLNNNCSGFFKQNENLKTISFENDTSNVTDMSKMFENCYNLTSVVGLNTSKCTKFNDMFRKCVELTNVDTSNFNTSLATDMSGMFRDCYNLSAINVSGFDTSKVEHMNGMFSNCEKLSYVDVSGFNTGNVEDNGFSNLFYGCESVEELDVSNWTTSKATNINSIFCYCSKLQSLDLDKWDLSNVTWGVNVILGCRNLQEIKTPLNLKTDIQLPGTFAREDDSSITYTSLPMEQEESFTIVRSESRGGNIISVDYDKGIAVVRDEVSDGEATVPIYIIDEGYVHRLYDPNRGEHLYTKDSSAVKYLESIGWIHESNEDFVAVDARDEDALPVYRFYNPNEGGMHFYTSDVYEARGIIKAGWIYEGISHYVFDKDSKKGTPQHRLYNPNSPSGEHIWITDKTGYNMLVNAGWIDENISWNVLLDDGARSKEIVGSFRYIDPDIPELVCTYTFNADGTGTYDIAGEVQKLTYAIYGNELSIMFEGQDIPMNVEFTVDAEALTIVDGTGENMVYYRI